MIADLQNGRSLFLLNRHNIFKLLSKKNISAIFLVENDFETGIEDRTSNSDDFPALFSSGETIFLSDSSFIKMKRLC